MVVVHAAEPGSRSHEALQLLASWATTPAAVAASTADDH